MLLLLRACCLALGLSCLWCAGLAVAMDLGPVTRHLRERGATEVTEVARAFLFEGQATAAEQHLVRADCVAYLALGVGEVRDVDLALYTRSGQVIAEDAGVAPFAYARACGAAGLDLYASASLYAGRGELVLLRVMHAPRELGRLPSSVPFAVAPGGRLEELRAVGAASDDLSPESALLQEERAQAALGYTPVGAAQVLELRAGLARGQLLLRAAHCYRVMGVVPFSRGVAIELEGNAGGRWSTRSVAEDRSALALCAPSDGSYAVRLQARPLRGVALLRVFEHKTADPALARESGEASALAIAEAKHVAAQRGLVLAQLGSAWIEGSTPLVWSLAIERPGCYAFAAVSEVGAAAIDVRLTNASGRLLAHNEGRRGVPMVFTCAREAGSVRLVMKARGPDLRVSLWRGESEGAPR
ncbi:MAG: hypothetical protein JWN04_3917 [Myxococcaceae bacterium]|nr:hypothetical protein [Myxococcaceae bacterium]